MAIDSEERFLISNKDENTNTDGRSPETRVYQRRWWILILFSLLSCTQTMIWNTWAPIAESSELVFDWSDGNIAFISNLSNICFVLLVLPMCMVMDTRGLRFTTLLCAGLLVLGTAVRCLTFESAFFTAAANLCNLLQGVASTTSFPGPPLLASVWFPPEQRPTATAIVNFFNYFGISLSFIIGPQLVPGPLYVDNVPNQTQIYEYIKRDESVMTYPQNDSKLIWTPEVLNLNVLKERISQLMYIHCGLTAGLFLLVLVHFPAKPPVPPSITASVQRVNCKQALAKIVRNGPLWLIVLSGALSGGVSVTWITIIDIVVKPLGVSQIDAGWMGFWNTTIGCFAGIIVTKFSDFFYRRRKIILISLFACAVVCSIWFALLCASVVEFSLLALYSSCILLGIFVNGTIPMFFEMAVEASYPVAEGVTGGFYTLIFVLFGAVLLTLISVPNIGILWINWVVFGSLCLAIGMLFAYPEIYNRTDVDIANTK